jgi:hypothetical protein
MEISPISAVRLAPAFRSRETDLGLTDVFEVESSSRIGDETYSPGGEGAASGYEGDEDTAEDQEESDPEAEAKLMKQKAGESTTQEISFFA